MAGVVGFVAAVARWPVNGRVSCLRWLVVKLPSSERGNADCRASEPSEDLSARRGQLSQLSLYIDICAAAAAAAAVAVQLPCMLFLFLFLFCWLRAGSSLLTGAVGPPPPPSAQVVHLGLFCALYVESVEYSAPQMKMIPLQERGGGDSF